MSEDAFSEEDIAARVTTNFLKEAVRKISPIVGKGSVNRIFIVETDNHKVVVRTSEWEKAFQEYEKEAWCSQQANKLDIPGPQVLTIGKFENSSYAIHSFVAGDYGLDRHLDKTHIWRTLGEYARRIHSIKVSGFGDVLADPKKNQFQAYNSSWQDSINYHLDCLTENDEFIKLGVYNPGQTTDIRRIFKSLGKRDFNFALNHGDLSLRNTLVDQQGKVSLLDWGCAEAHIVPHTDLICIFKWDDTPDKNTWAFLEGYGITKAEFAGMEPEIDTLVLMRAFDKLRWAIDFEHPGLESFVSRAKEALRKSYIKGYGNV